MPLKVLELISLVLAALVAGMFGGPWVAVSRSFAAFPPDVFLAVVHRMARNIGPVMTILLPAALLSIVPVLVLSYHVHPGTFYLSAAGFAALVGALLVTMWVEVPIVTEMDTWTAATLPDDWQQRRDRWGAFHVVRVVAGIATLVLLAAGALV